uniref:Uncharacterized protein n=1 Tax=Tanacetum cinerariifolium TaxID=118510 RepID=A0A699ITJ8_TANCI|nr:hypothetical protein [Tanacetum cinerariifolium]
MESSSSNSEEMKLQHMQLDEMELHKSFLAWPKKLKIHLGFLHSSFDFLHPRPFEIAFRIFFREQHQAFREKMYHNLNQLQWQLERDNFHGHDSKTCLVVLKPQFKEFFVSKEVNASDVPNKCWQNSFSDGMKWEPENFRRLLLCSEGNDADADIGSSNDGITVFGVYHNLFKNMFSHGIQNHKQLEYILDTYVVNENNSNIVFDIPNMDLDRNKEEHDYVEYEKHRAFFASLINNLKCDVEKCNETGQTLRMLLPNEDNVQTGKRSLGFENQNDNVNPSVVNKAKELAPCLYNIDEIGKDELSDHKIISEKELKCEVGPVK